MPGRNVSPLRSRATRLSRSSCLTDFRCQPLSRSSLIVRALVMSDSSATMRPGADAVNLWGRPCGDDGTTAVRVGAESSAIEAGEVRPQGRALGRREALDAEPQSGGHALGAGHLGHAGPGLGREDEPLRVGPLHGEHGGAAHVADLGGLALAHANAGDDHLGGVLQPPLVGALAQTIETLAGRVVDLRAEVLALDRPLQSAGRIAEPHAVALDRQRAERRAVTIPQHEAGVLGLDADDQTVTGVVEAELARRLGRRRQREEREHEDEDEEAWPDHGGMVARCASIGVGDGSKMSGEGEPMGASARTKTLMPTPEQALPGRKERMPVPERHHVNGNRIVPPFPEGLELALFGLGCFWGAEKAFWKIPGVYSTAVGYAAGITPNPDYEEVCTGRTGHNEVVRVVFDPKAVS